MNKISKAQRKIRKLEKQGKRWIWFTDGKEGGVFDVFGLSETKLLFFRKLAGASTLSKSSLHIAASKDVMFFLTNSNRKVYLTTKLQALHGTNIANRPLYFYYDYTPQEMDGSTYVKAPKHYFAVFKSPETVS